MPTQQKIISANEIDTLLPQIHANTPTIVLVGGCFDILHIGHIIFLEEAKKQGNKLIVLLESDASIRRTKGPNRPINTQHDRAKLLASLEIVDTVVLLDDAMENRDYDRLVFMIKPAIIATTTGDAFRFHKERQAEKIGAVVKDVTPPIQDKSTTQLFKVLNEI